VYVDESGIDKYMHQPYGYALKGEKIYGKISGRRFARENFIAAEVNKKIIAPMCYRGGCNTELFEFWVEKFLVPKLVPGQIVIMDHASFYKSEKMKRLIINAKCSVL